MDDEDVAKAVEERRAWLEGHLHHAAEHLGADLAGDKVVNTYDMRSAGSRATEQDGTEVWLRVVLSVPDYQPACRWDGNIDANAITGVPKPRVLRWADWHDTTNYRGGSMLLRGEVMTLAPGTVIAPAGSLYRDPGLPSSWWDNLKQALTVLAAHPVPRPRAGDTVDYVINNARAHFDVEIDRAVFDHVIWTTAHNDLHWGNVTGPDLFILDWESWGRAPAGYDASTLLCAQPPAPADRHSNSRDTSSSTRQPQWPRRTPRCSLQIPGSSKRTRGTIAQTRCCHDQGEESRAATISLVKLPPPWPASSSTTRLLSGQARCRCHAVSSGPDTS